MKIDGEKFLDYLNRTTELGKGISDRHLYVADRIEEYGFNKRLSMV